MTTDSEPCPLVPTLTAQDGRIYASSHQIAEHFDKRHDNVVKAIRKLLKEIGPEHLLNFEEVFTEYENGNGATQRSISYRISRDGFALLAMGFTGAQALKFKLAYIAAFNAMESKLREGYVEPLLDMKQFRDGIPLRYKLKLQEQGRMLMSALLAETARSARLNIYWQLVQVNESLGIPTEAMATLVDGLPPDAALPAAKPALRLI